MSNDADTMETSDSETFSEDNDGSQPDVSEKLQCDESAYVMYHKAETECSCLSFDILRDSLGDERTVFPHTCYIVAGTQTEKASDNRIIVMKMANLHKTLSEEKALKEDDESSDDDDNEDDDDDDNDEKLPELEMATIRHNDSINRLRLSCVGEAQLAASWSANGTVYIWNIARPLSAVNDASNMTVYTKNNESPGSVFSFTGHQTEGYSLDWSPLIPGQLLSGDCNKNIHMWVPKSGGTWHIDQRPYSGHTASVEDIQWSPNERNVFSSCSVDRSIRIWDTRATPDKACKLTVSEAHSMDVNVLNWNRNEPFIVSGGDDGIIKVWDLRHFKKSVALFKHHTASITSIEWHPTDSSVFAVSAADDRLTIWDLAVERDQENAESEPDVPPQLLFVHQGQKDIKELHWHPQIPGLIVSTALDGFNVFKTISV